MAHAPVDGDLDIAHEKYRQITQSVELPPCPSLVIDVLSEAQKDEPDMRRITEGVSRDVAMSAAAVKLANSAMFGAGRPAGSVRQALDRLGTRNVVCVITAVALKATFTGLPEQFVERFWHHSAATASVAGMIARRQFGVSPDMAYTYALFHDAAIPFLMRRFPDYATVIAAARAEEITRIKAEDTHFQSNHAIVGALLTRNWGLPAVLGKAILHHHDVDAYALPGEILPGEALSLIAVTHVAERLISRVVEEKQGEVDDEQFGCGLGYLGLSMDDMADLEEMVDRAAA